VEKQCDNKINQSVQSSSQVTFKTVQSFVQNYKRNTAPRKVKVDFGWKIWLFSFFLNGKAFTLNNTNKT
jgi:hypothetical protein